ncbi:MAG: isoprenylcysteine carboxylmethyltransferase family protein [bacterium]|nr:isoprenylcysteine carboxylmethyltransferase family protein [bacterium]
MVTLAALPKIQIVRKIVLALAVLSFTLMFALTSSAQEAGSPELKAIRWIGILAIVICILGRTWCTLYIDGRKIEQLVTVGPYSVCRNPLYSFTILGVAGMGAQHGSLLLAAVFCMFTWLVFLVVVMLEESFLADMHGAMFASYVRSTPRFLPNPRLWRDVFTVTVRPSKLLRTFGDGLCFLIPIPLDAVFERLQGSGTLPVLLRLF